MALNALLGNSAAPREQPKFRWDDVEFKIEKTAYGVNLSVGRTPESVVGAFFQRVNRTDLVLFGAITIGLIYVIRR